MKIQLIVSEAEQIPEAMSLVKQKYIDSQKVKVISSEEDIDYLNKIYLSELNFLNEKIFDKVNLAVVNSQCLIAKSYVDPNSILDNFI